MKIRGMKLRWHTLLWLLPVGYMAVFFFYPLVSIFAVSLGRAENGIGATVIEVWQSASLRKAVGFTFWQAGLSTLLTLIVGLPGAYLFGRFEFRSALDNWVQLRRVAAARHPELDSNHGSVPHATVQLRQARLNVMGSQIDEAKGPVMPSLQCGEHLVVLLAHVRRRRVVGPLHPHAHA